MARLAGTKDLYDENGVKHSFLLVNSDSDGSWEKLFLSNFLERIDAITSKRMKIALYLLKHKTIDNIITQSIQTIAEQTSSSRQTVSSVIRILLDTQFLLRKGRVWVINPNIVYRGSVRHKSIILQDTRAEHYKPVPDSDAQIIVKKPSTQPGYLFSDEELASLA